MWCRMSIWQSWMPVCCRVLLQSVCIILFSFARECKMEGREGEGEGGGELMKVCRNRTCCE